MHLIDADIERVVKLMDQEDSVFVFGSNLKGIHGAGAARAARELYGAEVGIGEGPTGRAYALPTKRTPYMTLSLEEIAVYVERFLVWARANPGTLFVVTRVGCGRAGYTDEQIAPLFKDAPSNCSLPLGWRPTT